MSSKKSLDIIYFLLNNSAMIWLMEKENLASYIGRILYERRLTSYDVEARSGNEINQSYVIKLKNGDIKNPTTRKLQALARGLGVDEAEIFRVARGEDDNRQSGILQQITVACSDAENWTDEQKAEFLAVVKRVVAGIRAEPPRSKRE